MIILKENLKETLIYYFIVTIGMLLSFNIMNKTAPELVLFLMPFYFLIISPIFFFLCKKFDQDSNIIVLTESFK